MDDGSKASGGVIISTNSFSYQDIERLSFFLQQEYKLKTSVQRQGSQFRIYIFKESMPIFSSIVKKYMVTSMYYKLNGF